MKNLLIFLFGVTVGAGGMLIWLRKDIKKELETVKSEAENAAKSEQDMPFTVEDGGKNSGNGTENAEIVAVNAAVGLASSGKDPADAHAKVPYHTLFQGTEADRKNVADRDFFVETHENPDEEEGEEDSEDDPEGGFVGHDETDGGVFEIDREDFDYDKNFSKERYVFFKSDRVMCTEDGTPVTNPFIFVGGEWDKCVGNYAPRTAFIRNSRLRTDFEILVEDGLYSDEYGPPDGYRED